MGILNSFQLKVLAIVLMVIDHIGAILLPQYRILRIIGRLAFPIFCFLLVEGFYHTRNVQKYMIRLFLFALGTEVIYDLAFRQTWLEFTHQNVFFTLALGVVMMLMIEKSSGIVPKAASAIIWMLIADLIRCDYSSGGLVMILIFYLLHNRNSWIKMLGTAAGNLVLSFPYMGIQLYGALAAIPIGLYNGQEGRKMKYFFYVFYPLHLLILLLIKRLL